MATYTVHIPEGGDAKALEIILDALKYPYEKAKKAVKRKEKPYDPEYVAKILQGQQDLKDGKGIRVTLDEIWK